MTAWDEPEALHHVSSVVKQFSRRIERLQEEHAVRSSTVPTIAWDGAAQVWSWSLQDDKGRNGELVLRFRWVPHWRGVELSVHGRAWAQEARWSKTLWATGVDESIDEDLEILEVRLDRAWRAVSNAMRTLDRAGQGQSDLEYLAELAAKKRPSEFFAQLRKEGVTKAGGIAGTMAYREEGAKGPDTGGLALPQSLAGARRGEKGLRDGRYEGGNDDLAVELRVDTWHLGVISADLSRRMLGSEEYVASVRTSGEQRAHPLGRRWEVVGVDTAGEQAGGMLEVLPHDASGDEVSAMLWLDTPLNGLPLRRAVRFTATWQSPSWRRLGLEVERERGVTGLAEVTHDGRMLTLESCLRDAGFDPAAAGQPDEIPPPEDGWHLAQLHTLMADFAQAPLERAGWNVNVLLLSRSSRETTGLLGIMFDISATLPRQGVAVFTDEFAGHEDRDAKLLQTTVHELGHALNLAHRFDRDVGFRESLSHMNYDWRYRDGRSREEFWDRFDYTFDTDELAFLRHGPLDAVMPGGAPFRSVSYWVDAERGYTPFLPAAPHNGLQLTLEVPDAGPIFRLGQPVHLKVTLRNNTDAPLTAHSRLLDIRGGFLDVFVRPHEPGSTGAADGVDGWKATGWKATGWRTTGWKATGWKATGWKAAGWKATQLAIASAAGQFVPLAHRCYDVVDGGRDTIAPGEMREDNLALGYGAAGFVFTEPGAYDVIPLLYFTDVDSGREWLVLGRPLMIRVAHPTPREERDALTLFDDEVGVFFTLGGSETLTGARDKLLALREEHDRPAQDPIAAAITRTLALDRQRSYVRFRDGRYTRQAAEDDQARALLDDIDDDALRFFDPFTAERTRALRADPWR